ncbi:MAG: DNA polymerase IV [Ilumatobacteraceae bacterium]|jgi:DNA polymerase-4|nr:DNA polymerase IV [Ilumatobacteraceae bacterium]
MPAINLGSAVTPESADDSVGSGVPRRILHVDMNAFFVACELLRRPELAGQPVVVGGSAQRGVVAAASYEARQFGVHSAMASAQASRLCPHAIFLDGDHDFYGEISGKVFDVFREFTPLVEGLSLDEAFLDVTGAQRIFGDARHVAVLVRDAVREQVGLPCSVGIATSKFIAKLATEFAKPRAARDHIDPGPGVFEVLPGNEIAFLHPLAVGMLWGVGPVTLQKLHGIGMKTVGDIAASELRVLKLALGDGLAAHLYDLSNALDDRDVEPEREAKSIGSEETFSDDVSDARELRRHLLRMADNVARRCREHGLAAHTITLKIRYGDFSNMSRARTVEPPVNTSQAIIAVVDELLGDVDVSAGVRLAGVSLRNFGQPESQLSLFDEPAKVANEDWRVASEAIDRIREKFGNDAIGTGALDETQSTPWGPRRE